jgi:hypothetical protein
MCACILGFKLRQTIQFISCLSSIECFRCMLTERQTAASEDFCAATKATPVAGVCSGNIDTMQQEMQRESAKNRGQFAHYN